MGRELLRTPDEDVAQEFSRVCQLFQLALGEPSDRVLFETLMGEASAQGLNWVQGLEYVIERRDQDPIPEMPQRRFPVPLSSSGSTDVELRRVG